MSSMQILVVDDEQLQRRYYCRLLEERGYQAVAAPSGDEALAKFKRSPPNLALIDVVMPDTDGITLYKALQACPEGRGVPMLLLTGLNVPRSVLEAASVGIECDHIFIKGREEARMLSRIGQLLGDGQSKHSRNRPLSHRISIDQVQRRVWIDGKEVKPLATRRYDLLSLLIQAGGSVSRDAILKSVWPQNENLNTVDVTIRRLRHDLADFPGIHVVTTESGYRLSLDT